MRVIAAAILAVFSGAASAAPVNVRGGEHDSFTRVVLDLPARVPYEIDQSGPVTIDIPSAREGFDLSGAMRKLNAGRVIGISRGEKPTELLVTLGCECDADVFFAGNAMLVLDIRGDPSLQNVMRKRPVMRGEAQQEPKQDMAQEAGDDAFRLPLVLGQEERGRHDQAGPALPAAEPLLPDSGIARAERQEAARGQMLRQISRGVSQGMLKPVRSLPEPDAKKKEVEAEPSEKPEEQDAAEESPERNMRIVTSIDRDFIESRSSPLPTSLSSSCADDDSLLVQGWIGDEDFTERVGRLRSALFGEFDRINKEAARQLAQTYIAYGFGREALQALQTAELEEPQLAAMARIVEGHAAAGSLPADWQPDCDTAAALWAYLGGTTATMNAPLNRKALIAAFGALPVGLKAHLGARLAQRLADDGFENLAKEVLKLARRGAVDVPDEVTLAEAEIAETDDSMSERKLRDVIEANGVDAPKALISLIELQASKGTQVADADIELLEAFAKEYRSEPIGPRLEGAWSMALAQAGDHERSIAVLAAVAPKLEGDRLSMVTDHVATQMVRNAGDISFLALAFDERLRSFQLSSDRENAVAQRLIELGFAEQALRFLSGSAMGTDGRSRKILRAQAALELGRSRQAEAEILGLHGDDVETLRLDAHVLRGDHKSARITLETLGKLDQAAEQAWLAGEHETLRALGSEAWALEASLSEADTPQQPGAASLAKGRELLSSSADLRALVSDVLGKHEVTGSASLE